LRCFEIDVRVCCNEMVRHLPQYQEGLVFKVNLGGLMCFDVLSGVGWCFERLEDVLRC
jgi:hypothetical protein